MGSSAHSLVPGHSPARAQSPAAGSLRRACRASSAETRRVAQETSTSQRRGWRGCQSRALVESPARDSSQTSDGIWSPRRGGRPRRRAGGERQDRPGRSTGERGAVRGYGSQQGVSRVSSSKFGRHIDSTFCNGCSTIARHTEQPIAAGVFTRVQKARRGHGRATMADESAAPAHSLAVDRAHGEHAPAPERIDIKA
jgi:hypothetical protein